VNNNMEDWTRKLKSNPIDWLLDSNPWTRYKTLTDLHIIDDMFGVRGEIPERLKKGEKFEKPDLTADV